MRAPNLVTDLTGTALVKAEADDWRACMAAETAVYCDLDNFQTVEVGIACRFINAHERQAFAIDPSAVRLVAVFTAMVSRSGGGSYVARYLVRLPLGRRLPQSTGEALYLESNLADEHFHELSDQSIAQLRAHAAQGGAA